MKSTKVACIALSCVLLSSCVKVTLGTGATPIKVESRHLVNGYVACSNIRPYGGTLIEAELLKRGGRWGTVASLDVWPLGGIGFSFVGARMKILPIEIGVGILGRKPKPEKDAWDKNSAAKVAKSPDQPSPAPALPPPPVARRNAVREQAARARLAARQAAVVAASEQKPSRYADLRFRIFVDGSAVVKIQGDRLWIEHRRYELPGKWNGHDEPIYVNKMTWKPKWTGNISDSFNCLYRSLPKAANRRISLKVHEGRGKVSVLEYPSAKNNYTLSILLDDEEQLEADWYSVGVYWK